MLWREEKKASEMWGWKCLGKVGNRETDHKTSPLTDLTVVGDDTVNGTAVTAYEFFVRDQDQRLSVNKANGLPLRIDMNDPQMPGSLHVDYFHDNIGDIEIPACMVK